MDQVIDAFQRIDCKAFFQKLRVKGQDVALSDIRQRDVSKRLVLHIVVPKIFVIRPCRSL